MEEQNKPSLRVSQKILLGSLYFLLLLMVIFSFLAQDNVGEEGYRQCVQKKCEQKGEKFCSKVRELSNCCAGAGGNLAAVNNPPPGESPYTCVFE